MMLAIADFFTKCRVESVFIVHTLLLYRGVWNVVSFVAPNFIEPKKGNKRGDKNNKGKKDCDREYN